MNQITAALTRTAQYAPMLSFLKSCHEPVKTYDRAAMGGIL